MTLKPSALVVKKRLSRLLLEYGGLLTKQRKLLESDAERRKKDADLLSAIENARGRDIVILGASPSALEYEDLYKRGKLRNSTTVIGCNWTNFLDARVDFLVTAYSINAALARTRSHNQIKVIQATLDGEDRGFGVNYVKRRGFGDDVTRVLQSVIDEKKRILYTNHNVLFLMLSLAHTMAPKSLTFCGFENSSTQPTWTYFFTGQPARIAEIMEAMQSLPWGDLQGKDYESPIQSLVEKIYFNILAPELVIKEDEGKLESRRRKTINHIAEIRERAITEYMNIVNAKEIPLARIGATTLFADLPVYGD